MIISRVFKKVLTPAEVGNTGTHEKYIRLTNDFDYKSFFQQEGVINGSVRQIDFKVVDLTSENESVVDFKFVYYENSNGEKRIPSLGSFYATHNIQENDIIVLESRTQKGSTEYYFSHYKAGEVILKPSTIYYTEILAFKKEPSKFNLALPVQQIFYGAPGTGKSHSVKEITKDIPDDDVIRTTFHPDSDYSTFVGAYKPTMQEVPVLTVIGTKQVPVEDKVGKAVTERRIEYDFVPQAFTQAYVRAWRDLGNPVFLVIEEINRGNCAQIFGDIFQLLDRKDDGYSDYWITPDEELAKHLRSEFSKEDAIDANAPEDIRQGRKMCLPPNLHIWATMNTSDQSLFPIDSAFKRRWDWKYIPIDTSKENWSIMVNGSSYSWGQFLDKMNAEIGEVTSSEDKKMGFYFCKTPDGIIKADKFVGKVLFYVYNDVFKDYGFDRECFKDGDETITFHSFFLPNGDVNEPQVEKFLQKLKLSVEGEDEDGNNNSTPSAGRDYTKYSVNGEGQYGKNRVATECVKKYVELHPEKSAEEVLNDWQSLGVNVPHFIESKDVFESRTDSNMRSYPVECKGEIIYVAHNGYGSNGKVKVLMDAVNSKDWGIRIDEA